MNANDLRQNKDKLLFTPGPLTTSAEIKAAALHDLGSRDSRFTFIVKSIRSKLLEIGGAPDSNYDTILMQGSGTFGVEAVISSAINRNGKLLNIINGAYGRRISQIAGIHGIQLIDLEYNEDELPDTGEIENIFASDKDITHVSIVHCETTTGIINPIESIGALAKKYQKVLIVDAMSSFGAYEIDIAKAGIGFLISSSNKCIEGIPGFSFVIAEKSELIKCKGVARTLTLDIYDQWSAMNSNGQFRFTPPVQSLLAFSQALLELEIEGGPAGRAERYRQNNKKLLDGMTKMGFKPYLKEELRGYIITSFLYPKHPNFSFEKFYSILNDKGFVIYPGKLSKLDCFRIGNIGRLFPLDLEMLLDGIEETIHEMNLDLNI